jgi:site-specific recombinase XerD
MASGIDPRTESIIDAFLERKKKRKGFSPLSLKNYRQVILAFFTYVEIPLHLVTVEAAQAWLKDYSAEKQPRTLQNRLTILHSFFNYCISEELISDNPILLKWWTPKIKKASPRNLAPSSIAKVKLAIEKLSLRDRLIAIIFLMTGIRCSELKNLRVKDIDFRQMFFDIEGKGEKERITPFSESCSLLLEKYIEENNLKRGDFLIQNKYSKSMSVRHIRRIMNKIGKAAGLREALTAHVLRHTYATEQLRRGIRMDILAILLGHVDLSTTQIYADPNELEIDLEYDRCME